MFLEGSEHQARSSRKIGLFGFFGTLQGFFGFGLVLIGPYKVLAIFLLKLLVLHCLFLFLAGLDWFLLVLIKFWQPFR